MDERRERLQDALVNSNGGALGVHSVVEVRMGSTDVREGTKRWEELLAPYQPSADGALSVGSGPAVRLVRAEKNEMLGIVVAVTSLRKAEVFLRERMLLGTVSGGEITIDPSKIEGLDIRFVEKK